MKCFKPLRAEGGSLLLLVCALACSMPARQTHGQVPPGAASLPKYGGLSSTDWPFIRGPEFDGCSTETGLVDSFPPMAHQFSGLDR